jgi:hypothetical protein
MKPFGVKYNMLPNGVNHSMLPNGVNAPRPLSSVTPPNYFVGLFGSLTWTYSARSEGFEPPTF